jgi:hypothetical protein
VTELVQERLEEIVNDNLERIVGVYIDALEATRLQGDELAPDHALRLRSSDALLDRVIGKPVTRTELSGSEGGPLTLAMLLADDARDTINLEPRRGDPA